MPEYPNRKIASLPKETFFEILDKRGRNDIEITRTQTFEELSGMEFEVLEEHLWAGHDKLFKLSNRYYGTPDLWWVIGIVNSKPTDGHYSIGDVVLIPSNPQIIAGMV